MPQRFWGLRVSGFGFMVVFVSGFGFWVCLSEAL